MDSPRETILFGPRMAPFTAQVRRGQRSKGPEVLISQGGVWCHLP